MQEASARRNGPSRALTPALARFEEIAFTIEIIISLNYKRIMAEKKHSILWYIVATIAILAGCLLIWKTLGILLLAFAGILVAIALSSIAKFIAGTSKIPYRLVLTLVIFAILLGLALFFMLAAPLISVQLGQLFEQIPAAYENLKNYLNNNFHDFLPEGGFLASVIKNEKFFSQATELFTLTLGGLFAFFIFLLLGLYISYSPPLYYEGLLLLFPKKNRTKAAKVLDHIGKTLKWWLLAKSFSMTVIGVLTYIGLWILGMPLAFILALLIGLFTFIPYLGPIIASIPAILVGLAVSPWMGLYVLVLYIIIHIIEGYFITPYIEQRTVYLPPALTLFAQVILSILVGFIGLALASPVTAVILAFVEEVVLKKKSKVSS